MGVAAPPAPTGLSASFSAGTLSATWNPVSGATSYTCTMLFGFNLPTSFTATSTTPSCSFYGVSSAAMGVSVVANAGGASSSAAVAFPSVSPTTTTTTTTPVTTKVHTIICQKGTTSRFKTVRGTHPTCPKGWHRV